MRIRRGRGDDVVAWRELSVTTFTQTFGHLYRPQDLGAYVEQVYSIEVLAGLVEDPDLALWIAEEAEDMIGYVLAGPCGLPHNDVRPGDGEIRRLYLRQGHQGEGLGSHLMDAAMSWLLREGPRELWLGVWSQNDGARRFYERYGFQPAGEYHFRVGKHLDHELIYRCAAGAGRPA